MADCSFSSASEAERGDTLSTRQTSVPKCLSMSCLLEPLAQVFFARDSCVTMGMLSLQVLVFAFCCWTFHLFNAVWESSSMSTFEGILVFCEEAAIIHFVMVVIGWALMISSAYVLNQCTALDNTNFEDACFSSLERFVASPEKLF